MKSKKKTEEDLPVSSSTESPASGKVVRKKIQTVDPETLRIIAENTFHWEFFESKEGVFVYHSLSCFGITGYSSEEFINDQDLLRKIIHPDDVDTYLAHHRLAHSDAGHHRTVFRIITKSGQTRKIEHICYPIYDEDGGFKGIRGTNIDVTEKEEIKLALEESESKLRRLFDTMVQGVVYQDESGKINAANRSAENILGLSLDQMLGRESSDPRWHSIHEDGSAFPGMEHPSMVSLKTGKSENAVMGVFNPKSDSYTWINVNATPEFRDGEKTPYQVYTTFEDITELRNATTDLERTVSLRTKEILRLSSLNKAILMNAGLAIISTDTDGVVTTFNAAAEMMLGYRAIDVIGNMTADKFHDPQELKAHTMELAFLSQKNIEPDFTVFKTILERMPSNTGEWTYVRKDGSRLPVRLTITPLEEYEGLNAGYVGFALDISNEKETLNALLRSEERFYRMFRDHSTVMLIINPATGRIIEGNKAAQMFYGYDFNQPGGINISDINILAPEQIAKEMNKVLSTVENVFGFKHRLASGDIRDVEVRSTPIEMRGEKVLFSIIQDVTEKKRAEDLLKKSELDVRSILMAVPDILFRLKSDGTILFHHPGNLNVTGVPIGKTVGKNIVEVIPPDYHELALSSLKQVSDTGENLRLELEFSEDGNLIHLENRLVFLPEGEILSIIRDIKEMKTLERSLKWNENLLTMMASSSPLAFLVVDNRTDNILYFNSRFCEIWGITHLEQAMREGKLKNNDIIPDCLPVLKDVEAFAESCKPLQDENNRVVIEDVIPFSNGRYIRRFSTQIRDAEEKYYGRLYIFEDITQRMSTEKLLLEQKDLLSQLSSIADMTTVLNASLNALVSFDSVDGGGIYLLDPSNGGLRLMAHQGLSESFVEEVNFYSSDSPQVEIVMKGESRIFNYHETRTKIQALPDGSESIEFLAVFPILHEGTVQGCINLASKNKSGFYPSVLDSLNSIVMLIGGTIARIKAEEALISSRENFKLLFDTIDDFLFILDSGGNILFANPVVFNRLGYSAEELYGKHVLMVHPPERREEAGFIVGEMLMGRALYCPVPLICKDGEQIPVETRVVHGKWDGKDVLFGISRDVTEQRKAEAELRKQNAAFESFALPIIITDSEGHIKWANKSFSILTGYDREEYLESRVGDLVKSGKQDQQFYDDFWTTIKAGKIWSGELINRRKNGSLYPEELTVTPLLDYRGNISGFIAIKIDITNRMEMEKALRESEARWNFALEGSGDGVWDWNAITNEVFFSKQWKTMLGFNDNEIGNSLSEWSDRVHRDDLDKCYEDRKRHFNGETEIYINEHRILCKDGNYKWILDRGKVHEWDQNGNPLRVIGTHTDITHLKNLEQGLRNAVAREKELNELKSKFISVASHEFRTPLATILATSESLVVYRHKMTEEQINSRLDKVKEQVVGLSRIIDDVLHNSRMQNRDKEIKSESMDLAFTVYAIIQDFRLQTKGEREIIFLSEPPIIEIISDKTLIQHILKNLINNALKYSVAGTKVWVTISAEKEDVKICIKDQGIGIPQTDIKHLFSPFFRGSNVSDYVGTGLGLNIVKESLERLGGSINVLSELGRGTKFEIKIPINPKI